MMMRDFIFNQIKTAMKFQNDDGSFPPGCNGPYGDIETPIRNTCHYIYAMSKLVIWGYESKLLVPHINSAVTFILNQDNVSEIGSFVCRVGKNKNIYNGVIGQAWVLEALYIASIALKDERLKKFCTQFYNSFTFEKKISYWKIKDQFGNTQKFDMTFNHQLWFAAIGSTLHMDSKIISFMNQIDKTVQIYEDGVIKHMSCYRGIGMVNFKNIIDSISIFRYFAKALLSSSKMRSKSVGYHSFNLYALAILYKVIPDNVFWESKKFKKILEITLDETYLRALNKSEYSWFYNVPGYELAYVYETFGINSNKIEDTIKKQINITINNTNKNSIDWLTLDARVYELTRLENNYSLQI